ncbi:MAG: GDP-6-deoxy-D-talose 4-dehydrogenase [Polaribacter sejongensis]|nr:MAG: GDP-6-deoxy-D-talose 4-dehydrogenase [Polaribacter sejongensis]
MEAPSNKNILVTGISGFTGKHLETYLTSKGFTVFGTVIDIPKKETHFSCDILNEDAILEVLEKVRPAYIINLAAISFVAENNKENIYKVNVFGALNLLNAVEKLDYVPQKIVMISSATVYGNIEGELFETFCPQPVNHYGNSKLVMENMVKTFFDRQNIIITRPFNYTGIHQEEKFLIPKIIEHYAKGLKKIALGNIDVYREFNDIGFVVETYTKLLTSEVKSEIVNICSGAAINIKKILKTMDELSGYTMEVEVNPAFIRKNEIVMLKGSAEKLSSFISFSNSKYSIENTLTKMYNHKILKN